MSASSRASSSWPCAAIRPSPRSAPVIGTDRVAREPSARPVTTRITTRITGPRAGSGTGRSASADGLDHEHARMKDSLDHLLSPLPTIAGYGLALHYEPMAGVGG